MDNSVGNELELRDNWPQMQYQSIHYMKQGFLNNAEGGNHAMRISNAWPLLLVLVLWVYKARINAFYQSHPSLFIVFG